MRVAQVAPLYESVPPSHYGGTERIVSSLTEQLIADGHQVTLYASGDSRTAAELIAPVARSLRLDATVVDHMAHHILQLEWVRRDADRFDVIHFHCDYLHFPLSRRMGTPNVTTLHGRLDLSDLVGVYEEFTDMPLVSISVAQRTPLPRARWVGNVYHGMDPTLFRFSDQPGAYLAFLGRFTPEKGAERAIAIARKAELPLKMAGKVHGPDLVYFDAIIRPLLHDQGVEFLGEIDESEKGALLGGARCVLFPIDWPEPFGLVMIEALAAGTPVIGFPHGSVPEILEDGVTGFIVDSIEAAVDAVHRIGEIDRRRCRKVFEERFSVERMTADYVQIYEQLVRERA